MKGVFLDVESLMDLDLDFLADQFDSFEIFKQTAPSEIQERIKDADVLIVNKVKLTGDILKQNKQIQLICLVATGTDNVDCGTARELGMTVCNCQAYGTDSVAQHVFSVLLALHTNLIAYHEAVRQGKWQKSTQFCLLDYPITEMKGKTLGIIGYGTLGSGVAEMARAFGLEVVLCERPGLTQEGRVPFDEFLSLVDIITLHCPLTESTKNLIGADELEQMKPSALLINAARGGIVDEEALAHALREGIIAGAATDVLSKEPPDDSNPLLADDIPNLIITPHCAWGSFEARDRIVEQTTENIVSFFNNNPMRVVN